MSVIYLLTSPEPILAGTDAAFQEIAMLKGAFNGETVNLCPRKIPGRPFPPQLFGFHRLPEIWHLEKCCEINHVYHSIPYPFPVLKLLRNPVVYTVLTSLRHLTRPARLKSLGCLYRIVVSNERDADILKSWGLSNYAVVPPAMQTSHLSPSTLAMGYEVVLLMASAPWVEDQFDTKGVDTLLDAAARLPNLRLIFLCRGLLQDELLARVDSRGIKDRVEIVSHRVDINDYLKKAHAVVLLAKRSDIVKAYPHSLLESLIVGKPVILSNALPLADYVRRHGCGLVLDEVNIDGLIAAVDLLRSGYDEFARKARLINPEEFSEQVLVNNYREIYRSASKRVAASTDS